MKQYVVQKGTSYLEDLYKNSTTTTKDVGEAMKFISYEMAKQFLLYLTKVIMTSDKCKIYCIETTISEAEEDKEED